MSRICFMAFLVLVASWSLAGRSNDAVGPLAAEISSGASELHAITNSLVAERRATREANARIEAALDNGEISGRIVEKPLHEAVALVCRQAGIRNFRIDKAALAEEVISPDEPCSREYERRPPRIVFRELLEPHGLRLWIDGGVLTVTTAVKMQDVLVVRSHDVRTLRKAFSQAAAAGWTGTPPVQFPFDGLPPTPALTSHPEDARGLVQLVVFETSGPWKEMFGDGGDVMLLGGTLRVRHTESVQEEVAILLRNIEMLIASPSGPKAMDLHAGPAEAAILRKLRESLLKPAGRVALAGVPLDKAMARFREELGGRLILDETAFMEEGIPLDRPITLSAEGLTIATVLKLILEPLDLTYIIEDGVIKVTSMVKAEEMLSTIMYDVRDLLDRGVTEKAAAAVLLEETRGPWQQVQGDGGTITALQPGILVVRQTRENHEDVGDVLTAIREGAAQGRAGAKELGDERGDAKPPPLVMRFYPIDREALAEPVEAALTEFVAPKTWKQNGGCGTICRIDGTLVIRQTMPVHRAVATFLEDFEAARNRPAVESPATPRGF